MFSCEYCEIATYFEEHLYTTASEVTLRSGCLGLSFGTVAFKIHKKLLKFEIYKKIMKFENIKKNKGL